MTRLDWCHIGWAVIGLAGVTPILWMATDVRPCVTIYGGVFEPSEGAPGDKVMLKYEADEHMACGGYVIRRWIGKDHYIKQSTQEPTNYHDILNSTRRQFSVEITIPILPAGPATYAPIVYRWRNYVQKVFAGVRDFEVPQIPFEVLPLKGSVGPRGEQGIQGPEGRQGPRGPE